MRMNIEISDEIKLSASYCTKEFSCLSDANRDLCRVKEHIGEKVYFIACKEDKYCAYKESFGNENLCTCPVRKEIYDKYKI
jgi:hypothetical protein